VFSIRIFTFVLIIGFSLQACQRAFYPVKVEDANTEVSSIEDDKSIEALILPYRDSLKQEMGSVLVELTETIKLYHPECEIGNLVVNMMWDQYHSYAKDSKVDAVIHNQYGIRINEIVAGPVTKGKVFELLPFDNEMVVVLITGQEVMEWMDRIADAGGWPVFNINYTIEENSAINVLINGEEVSPFKMYRILTSNYLANGGDGLEFLKDNVQESTGIMVRDAMLGYLSELNQRGEKLSPPELRWVIE
jgi:2',3'-cyclic-nucleotide 2'-phosphodiesterase (5'-nucleotidase family)